MKFTCSARRAGKRKSKIAAAAAALRGVCGPIESLERRVLLASTTSWISPYLSTGTSWTFQETNSTNDNTTVFSYAEKGPATAPSGQSAFELDVTSTAGPGMFKGYYGTDSAGDLVEYYGISTVGSDTTTADAYSPYEVDLPATLPAGQTVTTTDQDVNTLNSSGGSSTDTSTVTKQFTLASEIPTPVTVGSTTYDCYVVTVVETSVGSSGSMTTPDTSQNYFAPNVGVVKSVDTDGTVGELTSFTPGFHLAVTQPNETLFDDPINPAVQVSIQNSTGSLDTTAADQVTLTASIAAGSTGTGALNGSLTATTVGGLATFSDLSITKPGQYILTFTDSTGRAVQTQPFQITAGKLIFRGRVSNGVAGSSLDPGVEIELVNNKRRIITDADNLVTISIGSGDSSCPLTNNAVQLVHGVAVFPALKLGKPGMYTLAANDANGDTKATSNPIEITGLHIAFARGGEIKEAGAGVPLAYKIELEDFRNRLVNNSSLGLQLTLTPYNSSTGVLSGIADVFSFGVAENSVSPRISIDQPGDYTVTFSVLSEGESPLPYQIEPITTGVFKVVANHLDFVSQPRTTGPNLPLKYDIEVRDYLNKVVNTNSGDTLSFSLIGDTSFITGTGGSLSGTTDSVIGGNAQNSNGISITAAGTYQLVVTDLPTPGHPKAAGVMSKKFQIKSLINR